MALAFVKKDPNTTPPAEATGVASLATTFDSNTASGNLLVATGTTWVGGTAPTMTFSDNKSNDWSSLAVSQLSPASVVRAAIGYAANVTGGSTHTVTLTPSVTCDLCLGVAEHSGVALSSPISGTPVGAGGSSTAPSSGATTPAANALYIGAAAYAGATTTLVLNWASATQLHNEPDTTYPTLGSAYIIGSGSMTAQWTLGASREWAACVAAFAEAGDTPPDYGTPRDHSGCKPWSSIWRPARA